MIIIKRFHSLIKLFILTIIIGISASGYAQQLRVLSGLDIREFIRDVKFVNATTGWIAGGKGMIYKTTNAGKSWSEQNSGTEKDLTKIFFINEQTGWTAAIDGSLFKTIDSGNSWTEFSYAQAVPGMAFNIIDLLKFFDENTGFIIAGKLKQIYLLKTTDGGASWSVKDSLVSTVARKWYDIDFNGSKGVLVGDKKDIQKCSSDFGETWTFSSPINDNFFRDLKYVKFITAAEVIAMGEGNEFSGVPVPIYKSSDSGLNWVKKNQNLTTTYDRIKGAYFKNGLEGIGIGSDGFSKAFVVKTTDGGESWSSTALDFAFGLQSICGIGDFLFVLGTSSHMIFSNDFGETWQIIPLKVQTSIISINFKNDKGYAVTRNGDVYISSDGTGNSWEYLSHAGKNISGAVTVLDNGNIFILKDNRHIVKSDDNGLTWRTVLQPVAAGSRNLTGGMDFGDPDNGYAWLSLNDYGEYHFYKTTDGGESWSEIKTLGGPGYLSGNLLSFDSEIAVALGPDQWTLRTSDGGLNWGAATLNNFPPGFEAKDFEDAVKLDESRAVAVGEKFICTTTDKGATWEYLNHGLNDIDSNFYKATFSSDTLGYIALYYGTILKTTDLGATWTKDDTYLDQHYLFASGLTEKGKIFFGTSTGLILGEETITSIEDTQLFSSYSLNQNYPNPFNPSTTLSFALSSPSLVQLKIYDVLGNEISTLINEERSSGEYEIEFNASMLSSGVYYYRLFVSDKSGGYSESKKMLLLK